MKTPSTIQVLRQQEDDRCYWKGDYLSTTSTPRSYIWMFASPESNTSSCSSVKTSMDACCITDVPDNGISRESNNNVISSSETSSVAEDLDESDGMNHHDMDDNQRSNMISPSDRRTMILWCHQVLNYCQMKNLETIEMVASYMDRYCWISYKRHVKECRKKDVKLSQQEQHQTAAGLFCCHPTYYQLVTITCFYMALKLHESHAMHPRTLVKLSSYRFTEKQIVDMEMHILFTLNWKMNPPTVGSFIRYSIDRLIEQLDEQQTHNADDIAVDCLNESTLNYQHLSDLARSFAEHAIYDYNVVSVKASVVAYCCVLNACQVMLSKTIKDRDHLKNDSTYRTIESQLATILDLIPTDSKVQLLQDYLYSSAESSSSLSSNVSVQQVEEVVPKESFVHTSSLPTTDHSVISDRDKKPQETILSSYSKKQKQCDPNIQLPSDNMHNHNHHHNESSNQERMQSSFSDSHRRSTTDTSAILIASEMLVGSILDEIAISRKVPVTMTYSSKSITASPQCISISPSGAVPTSS